MSDLSPASHPAIPPICDARRQAIFCEALATSGNVRVAAAAACISPQTAYRSRHAAPDFARLWDAALVLARAEVEQVLADRAMNGVEEAVFYHGEEVATRRRYDSRLLLAHLARLDRLADQAQVRADAAGFEQALVRLEAGEALARSEDGGQQAGDDEPGEDEPGDDDNVPLVEQALRWLEQQESGEEDDWEARPDLLEAPDPLDQDPADCVLNPVPGVPAIEKPAKNTRGSRTTKGAAIAGSAPFVS